MSLLSSLHILDFSTLIPGPFASLLFADLGADVVKVESPKRPDLMRFFPPIRDGKSATYDYLNRSKRSVAIDLKNDSGVAVIKRLVRHYDIIIEQFRPGVMQKLGLGYDELKEVNPSLIYCSITGYGQTGPYKNRAGHDLNYLSVAGVASYNGRKKSGPTPINLQVADIAGGSYHAVMSVLAAVIHRNITGEGQYIDVSLTDAAFSMQVTTIANALLNSKEPELETDIFNGGTFYDCYETRDGRFFSICSIEPQFFTRLCELLGFPELGQHALSSDPEIQHMLKERISAAMKTKTFAEWKNLFEIIDACVEPVSTLTEAIDHPQIKARELIVDVPDGAICQKQMGFPVKFSSFHPTYKFTAVESGEHTEEILLENGFNKDEIDQFRKSQGI
ncbi:MAG: CoA transferase [Desulfamplus sp.]|nr:CoA transferase [Desulfamplus sp.]